MEASQQSSATKNEQYWRDHVTASQQFMGSDQEYCKRNGLNGSTFSAYKLKMGLTKPRKKPKPQAFVQVESKKIAPPAHAVESRPVPDPKWTADLIRALLKLP